jgi:trk system potassium uptake protein TrkA
VWLCRTLHDRNFSIRLFEINRERAHDLAEKLDWVTVIHANPTDRTVAEEEKLGQADVFIALRSADEDNIIASVLAKTQGVTQVIAVVHSATYHELGYLIGVDRPVNPSEVAAAEILRMLDDGPYRRLSAIADGVVDAYQLTASAKGEAVGKKLKEIKLSPNWIVAAIRRGDRAWVPGADDTVDANDIVLLVGKHGTDKQLKKLFREG